MTPLHETVEPESFREAGELLSESIVSLLTNKRFYFEVLNRMVKRVSSEVDTMGVFIEKGLPVLAVNPDFFCTLDSESRHAWLEHEILHVVFRHPLRLKDRDPRLFGMACDMAVNQLLEKLPSGFILPAAFFSPEEFLADREAEYYYTLLLQRGAGNVEGESDDDHQRWDSEDVSSDPESSEDEMEREAAIERLVQGAVKGAGGKLPHHLQGSIPLEIECSRFNKEKPPWRHLLYRYLNAVLYRRSITDVEVLISKRRPHRKMGFPFPSLRAHPKRNILAALVIDASGSVSNEKFSRFLSEVQGLWKRDISLNLVFCDSDICRVPPERLADHDVKKDLEKLNYRDGIIYDYRQVKFSLLESLFQRGCFPGRGGTSYVRAVRFLEALNPRPDCIIYFTDSYDDGSLEMPSVPLLFVLTERREDFYDWATFVMLDEK